MVRAALDSYQPWPMADSRERTSTFQCRMHYNNLKKMHAVTQHGPWRQKIPSYLRRSALSEARRFYVSGPIYDAESPRSPKVTLFTKAGCTLCDEATAVLRGVLPRQPHSLTAVDISEHLEWSERYWMDIPVLHVNGEYWTKHCVSHDDAVATLGEAARDSFILPRHGEPDARRSRSLPAASR